MGFPVQVLFGVWNISRYCGVCYSEDSSFSLSLWSIKITEHRKQTTITMARVLIIGAGGVGTVVAKKVAMNHEVFTDIMLASRTKSKCDKIAKEIEEALGGVKFFISDSD